MKNQRILIVSILFFALGCEAGNQKVNEKTAQATPQEQEALVSPADYHSQRGISKLYVIEREMPGAGTLTPQQLKEASEVSNDVLGKLGPQIKWIHSYVTENKIYCVYSSPSEELIKKHAKMAGFPADVISEAKTIIDPSTAE